MRCGWIQTALVALFFLPLAIACSEAPEESTIEPLPRGGASGDEEETVFFDEDLAGDDCCDRFCTASMETGCTEYGDTLEACVINVCPIPGALEEPEASACRAALSDALCCSWQKLGADGCAVVDPHGTAECGSEATAADDACSVP